MHGRKRENLSRKKIFFWMNLDIYIFFLLELMAKVAKWFWQADNFSNRGCDMKRRPFTLIELLVVIAIITTP